MKTKAQHLGWYSRGYISHYDRGDIHQVITYRLKDSIPMAKLHQINCQLQQLDPRYVKAQRRKKIENWLNAGHGCCILKYPACAEIVIDSWKFFDGIRYDLKAWVVMPNHVHVLAYFRKGWPLGKVINSWKSYSARRINQIIRLQGLGAKMPENKDEAGLWQRGYWDRYIRDEAHYRKTIRYILENPVASGLVKNIRDWPFSSIRMEKRRTQDQC